jgi:paraquat-inducible protein B
VGGFVLGAVALVLGAVVFFSAGDWFEPKERFVVFFPGSVRGLNPGAPVTMRGVKIGEVKHVTALSTGKADPLIQIEVQIELQREVIEAPRGIELPWANVRGAELARRLIAAGVRARLMSQSLLTGQKYIELDILPREPARLAGLERPYPELPTTPTAMERMGQRTEALMEKLADLPLDQMLEDVRQAVQSLRTLLDSPDLRGTLAGARRGADQLAPALADVRAAVGDARRLIDTLGDEAKGTGSEARQTMQKARDALDRVERAASRLDGTAEGADEARVRASQTLEELDRTLKSLRNLVDYIQTHPEAVVLGKTKAEREK